MLLDNPGYADAARAVSRELAKTDGAACAAEELISCLHDERNVMKVKP